MPTHSYASMYSPIHLYRSPYIPLHLCFSRCMPVYLHILKHSCTSPNLPMHCHRFLYRLAYPRRPPYVPVHPYTFSYIPVHLHSHPRTQTHTALACRTAKLAICSAALCIEVQIEQAGLQSSVLCRKGYKHNYTMALAEHPHYRAQPLTPEADTSHLPFIPSRREEG